MNKIERKAPMNNSYQRLSSLGKRRFFEPAALCPTIAAGGFSARVNAYFIWEMTCLGRAIFVECIVNRRFPVTRVRKARNVLVQCFARNNVS